MVKVHTQIGKPSLQQRLLNVVLRTIPNLLTTLAMAGLIIGSTPGVAFAIDAKATPQGGSVVAGSASFSRSSGSLIVNQKSQRTVIDWQSFDIGSRATTQFKQPKASSLAVNRVVGKSTDPTQILGTLKSNGQVMVLDRNGVMFGKTARVDVGGIIASTGSIDVNQVMSGSAKIDINGIGGDGAVTNQGRMTAKQGGLVALVAPHVANSGVITANLGRVELASGEAVTVDLYGDKLVGLAVEGALANALVENSGTLAADGGRVALTARAAQGVVNNVINTTGIIRANTVSSREGRIVLKGDDSGTVRVAGKISATGTTGGRIDVTGNRISVDNAQINASGSRGGGEVYIGGGLYGYLDGQKNPAAVTDVSAGAVIKADATTKGNGGTVVVWGNEHTGFYGNITARGGALGGNGGMVEVSTGKGVDFKGIVDTKAPKGTVGELLIDPAVVFIGNGAELSNGSYLNAQNIANNLVFTSVSIQADSNIDVIDDVNLATSIYGTPTFDLSLIAPTFNLNNNLNMSAFGNLFINANTVNLVNKITSGGNLINPARVFGTATQANVLANTASIQQAMAVTSRTAPVTVQLSAGEYHENLTISKADLTLRGNAGTADAGADAAAAELFGTQAGGNIITVTANNVTINGLHLNAEVGDNTVADSVNGVSASGVNNLTISQNTLEGFTGSGISTSGSTNVTSSGNLNTLSPEQQAAADAAAAAAAQAAAEAAAAQAAAEAAAAQAAAEAAAAQAAAEAAAAQAAAEAAAAQAAAEAAAAQAAAEAAAAQAAAEAAAAQAAAEAAAAQAAAEAAAKAAALAAAQALVESTKEAMKEATQAFAHADKQDKDALKPAKDAAHKAYVSAVQALDALMSGG